MSKAGTGGSGDMVFKRFMGCCGHGARRGSVIFRNRKIKEVKQ